jgi:formylglycine-generating enzyme required for sulfatase activity
MEKRPNFYIILELDPSIMDWSTIEKAIQNKHHSWAIQKSQGSPAARRKAERYMQLLPEIKSLLKQPENRKNEARIAIKELETEKQAQLENIDQLIYMLNSSTVSSEDVKLLVRHSGKYFSELEIKARLRQCGIRLELDTTERIERPKLETTVAKGIRSELDSLKLGNLYDFLNLEYLPKLNFRSSPKSLYERADAIYKDLSKIGKTDSDTSLKMNLAGRAKSVFTNNTEKQRYDNTLATENLVKLNNKLEIAGRHKFIETIDIKLLLQEAKKLGVTEIIAREYIEDYATKKKWSVTRKKTENFKLPLCGYCNTFATLQVEKYCRNCGEELVQPCPKCSAPTPTENAACSHCGCHTGDAPLVKALLKDGKRFMAEGDFEQAISHFNRALDYWTNWQPALYEKKRLEQLKSKNFESEPIKLIKVKKLLLLISLAIFLLIIFKSINNMPLTKTEEINLTKIQEKYQKIQQQIIQEKSRLIAIQKEINSKEQQYNKTKKCENAWLPQPEMVNIHGGKFLMGNIQGKGNSDEQPVHWVKISPFSIGRYEVTFEEYDNFAKTMGKKIPNSSGWKRANYPVINISWHDAMDYANCLSQQTGQKYRLPTEAEWEYSARAGMNTHYSWGNRKGSNNANCSKCSPVPKNKTMPVNSFKPNSFGLYNMQGNVAEWTCSEIDNKYQGKEQKCIKPNKHQSMVIRGGSWKSTAKEIRTSARANALPNERNNTLGFRMIKE